LNASNWPLIGYLYQDEVYRAAYDDYVEEVIEGPFSVSHIQAQYSNYAAMIEPYATSEVSGYTFLNSSADFQSAVSILKSQVAARVAAANSYLN